MSILTDPDVHAHPHPQSTLLPHLLALLPHTLPLVRRLQFHHQSPHAHIIATLPPVPITPGEKFAPSSSVGLFTAAYIDRSRAPETECWIFSSIELPPSFTSSIPSSFEERKGPARLQLQKILAHIQTLPIPPGGPPEQQPSLLLVGAIHRTVLELLKGEAVRTGEGKKVISGPGANGYVTTQTEKAGEWNGEGSAALSSHFAPDGDDHVHGSTSPAGASAKGCIRGHTVPYIKFLFTPENVARGGLVTGEEGGEKGTTNEGLPHDLAWSTVHEAEFPLVMSRTEIPRKERTMRLLGSVGVRRRTSTTEGNTTAATTATPSEGSASAPISELIAWAFLGPDGSLTSLHVEPEFRGKGLGKLLTKRLFGLLLKGEAASGFRDVKEGEAWAHSDVAKDNGGSIGVARGLGGGEGWECFWGWVDLSKVRTAL